MKQIHLHPLLFYDERPEGACVDTIIVHSLFALSSPDPFDTAACISALTTHKVASHYLIARDGEIYGLVDEEKRAWHAGDSQMCFDDDARCSINDFSIGIELIATETSGFTELQYESLAELIGDIIARHPISSIVGHENIAPTRKTDPGKLFHWKELKESLKQSGLAVNQIRFPSLSC